MLRIIQNRSAGGAKSYYSAADYYTEGQELTGAWRGIGAQRLGLQGGVDQKQWDALCDNLHPATGDSLTARNRQNRSIGYDFNFHVPKSLSVLHALTQDERLLTAFRESVNETMREMEAEMQTRVRVGGQDADRTTGNMVWGEFIHTTSRPVDGVPDPHLHAHCFVFNSTFDVKENRWKAGQFRGVKQDSPYFEAVFHSKLSERMVRLGLPVVRTKAGWEIAGLDKASLDKFSRRTARIEAKAREQGLTGDAKAALGAKTREKKAKDLSTSELRGEWTSRLTADEHAGLKSLARRIGGPPIPERQLAPRESALHAVDHSFERQSVVPHRTLLREALRHSYGQTHRQAVERTVGELALIHGDRDGRRWVTSRDVLAGESAMLDFARRGRGTCSALRPNAHRFNREWLTKEQKNAVKHVLTSLDRVTLVRGAAGVGKTTMMMEAVEAIESSGKDVFTFAPSADASRGVLREAGFASADTIARLLADTKLQEQVKGQVLWIDEAGFVGVRTMKRVFDLADTLDCRVILSGDVRQHRSVEAGSALRLLETEAGLVPATITAIQRQKGEYRRAVAAISEGRIADGFRQLDAMGSIKEVEHADRYKALASDYMASVAAGMKTLVVSPTHLEAEAVTSEIRSSLRQSGQLGSEQRMFRTLENANLTVAERGDAVNLSAGDVLVYHQNARGHRKGDRVVVGDATVALDQAERFTVFHPGQLPLSGGDVIRITKNGKSREGRGLNNGDLLTVRGFTEAGDIEVGGGVTIARDYGHLAHGFVVTSHASQGKSVDKVILATSASSLPAANMEQFYVSVSRGKRAVSVYTDDKQALLEAVSRSGDQMSATELVAGRAHRERAMTLQRTAIALAEIERPVIEREGQTYER